MSNISFTKGKKRKLSDDVPVSETPSRSSKLTVLSPSLILLEVPAGTNTSLPVWDAMRSQQVDVSWTVNPYSVSVHVTPVTSQQEKSETSSQSESTSSMVIQSTSQSPCVVLTVPQTSTQPPQSPTTATTLILSLPLIITQPQPAPQHSTPKKQMQPSTPTEPPPPTPTNLQPSPSNLSRKFHTRSSPDIQICDNFLLSSCAAGKRCKMHHTRYPFHWQLWCLRTQEWVDLPARAQVLLERMYCNVHQEMVYIWDGPIFYTLIFESMEFDNQSKYERVRRLTNTESLAKNPHFPSKWKFYWWNNHDWVEYNKDVSSLLLEKMSLKEPNCLFSVGSQKYEMDFTTMVQTNVDTGFNREVRCRPVYRSPCSMQPYLQTGPSELDGDPPASNFSVNPLEEFSSWYPPVWCLLPEQENRLVDVPPGTQAYRSVQNLFYESLPETKMDIVSIQQVQNRLHWDKYQRHKLYMTRQHTNPKEPLERFLFHGTTKEASEDICHNNFDPRMAGVNGTLQGFGSYFATSAAFSSTFSTKTKENIRHMFLAKVLVGRVCPGCSVYRRPPPLNSKKSKFRLYDACVDDMQNPTMFVVFDSCQCYPYYLIRYKDLPNDIYI